MSDNTLQKYSSYQTAINWPWWVKKYGWVIHLVLAFLGIEVGAKMHENDFGGLQFIWHSAIGGLVFGILSFLILKPRFPTWTESTAKSSEIAFYIILSSVFLFVCATPVINKSTGDSKTECKEFKMKYPYTGFRKSNKYIHLRTGGKTERFKPPFSFFKELEVADSIVILCVRKGGLGYDYVEEFRAQRKH
jgi:hypothetical protein